MNELVAYARKFIGVPYYWGGAHPGQGLDCSGYMQIVLQFAGVDPKGDQTAQGLYDHFVQNRSDLPPGRGSLVFYGDSLDKIVHVNMMSTPFTTIGVEGGTRDMHGADAFKLAVDAEAFVKERPLSTRKDVVAVITPIYPKWLFEL